MTATSKLENTLASIPATKISKDTLFPILDEAWELRLSPQAPVPCFVGSPGVGKTQVTYQYAEARELDIIELNGSAMSPTDYVAFVPERDTRLLAEYLHENLAKCCDPGFKGILFIDELHQTHPEVQKPLSKTLNQRLVGSRKLSDNCMIVTAGNRVSDKAGANRLLSMIANRLDTIPVEVDNDALMDYFMEKGYPDLSIGYMAARPYNEAEDFQPHEPAFFTPRSFERAMMKLVARREVSPQAMIPLASLASSIGVGRARDFLAFVELVDKMPTMSDIVEDPDKCKVPGKLDEQCAVSCMLSVGAATKTFQPVSQYMQRFPISLQILFLKLALRREPECRTFPGFSKWVMKPEVRSAILDKKVTK
jgi:hypothetical protein